MKVLNISDWLKGHFECEEWRESISAWFLSLEESHFGFWESFLGRWFTPSGSQGFLGNFTARSRFPPF